MAFLKISRIVVLLILSLSFAKPIFAVTLNISNIPNSVTDVPFTINVSVSGASAGTNYLRVDLYKEGTTNYFGETYNGLSYYNGSDGKQYFPVTIVSGQTWNGSIQAKIGSPTQTEYPSAGTYKLRIRRYTSSGALASSDTQTPQDISVSYVVQTATPTPSSQASPSPNSTSSSSSFSISNVPQEIDSSSSFSVSINLSNSPNTKFYLKGAFKKVDSSNYFGMTKVGSNWIKNGSSYSEQYEITTDGSGEWLGNLEVQIDAFDSGYQGSGDYIFKVARYSSSGSGPLWSNENAIKINASEIENIEQDSEDIGVINLYKIASVKEEEEILGESSKSAKASEKPYSLEDYVQVSTPASRPAIDQNIKVKSKKSGNPFIIAGSIFILGSGFLFYKYYKFRLKS